jgi:hypothetical protein
METIAVYWEAKIKTYGFTLDCGQSLVRVRVPGNQLASCGRLCEDLAHLFPTFRSTFMTGGGGGEVEIGFLFEAETGKRFGDRFARQVADNSDIRVALTSPLDTVTFYGPHFQDRFGIAHAACDALAVAGIEPMATVCSGSTACLVLPEGGGTAAVVALRKAFRIPGEKE